MSAQSENNKSQLHNNISCDALTYEIDGKNILNKISLETTVNRLGVVGRNGSGKSTFVRLLTGLIAPSSGKISINGIDLHKDRKSALREVGILFQNADHQIIFPTVIEEIEFGLKQLGHTKTQANAHALATLELFKKPHWKEAYCAQLSQGQKHLLCLMSIVAMAPKIIILDEPFAGLDIPTKMQLNKYLALYEGSIIHITHDPKDIEDYDTTVWIDEGAIKSLGETKEILPDYLHHMNRLGQSDDITELSR